MARHAEHDRFDIDQGRGGGIDAPAAAPTELPRTQPPTRASMSGRSSAGMFLAIIAGLLAIGSVVWPIVPVAIAGAGAWWLVQVAAGAAFLVAAYVCLRRRLLARALLGVGGLALIAVAVILGGLLNGGAGLGASLLYLVPAALALVAAVLIEPA